MAKSWVSEQQGKVMDECLQLFGGYGYMMEYPIAELYVERPRAAHLRRHQRDHEGTRVTLDVSDVRTASVHDPLRKETQMLNHTDPKTPLPELLRKWTKTAT